jgi:hypothetical protein
LDYIDRSRKLQGSGVVAGIEDVQILILLDRKEEALTRLQRAVAAGWRFYSFGLRVALYDPLRDDPRFQAAVAVIEEDLAEQLAWYDENRDMPLESMSL